MSTSAETHRPIVLASTLDSVELYRPERLPARDDKMPHMQPGLAYGGAGAPTTPRLEDLQRSQARIKQELRNVSIRISPNAAVEEIKRHQLSHSCQYYKVDLCLQMVVPRGKVEELRYVVDFTSQPSSNKLFALDGLPKSDIAIEPLVSGKVTIGVSQMLQFIPGVAGIAAKALPLSFDLDPIQFSWGTRNRVNVNFSGPDSPHLEWYVAGDAIKGDFQVSAILQVPKGTEKVSAGVMAKYVYDRGLWWRARASAAPDRLIEVLPV